MQFTESDLLCKEFELDKGHYSALPMQFPSRERFWLDSGARELVMSDYPRYEDSSCKLIVTATGFGAHV